MGFAALLLALPLSLMEAARGHPEVACDAGPPRSCHWSPEEFGGPPLWLAGIWLACAAFLLVMASKHMERSRTGLKAILATGHPGASKSVAEALGNRPKNAALLAVGAAAMLLLTAWTQSLLDGRREVCEPHALPPLSPTCIDMDDRSTSAFLPFLAGIGLASLAGAVVLKRRRAWERRLAEDLAPLALS